MSTPACILVVDDDEAILQFIGQVLAEEGYAVETATNGATALARIAQAPPDLILLDMRMPVMDGWQFARAYSEAPGPHAPIIVMTAARDAQAIAADIHADGYLAKPFTLDRLLSVVEQHRQQAPASL